MANEGAFDVYKSPENELRRENEELRKQTRFDKKTGLPSGDFMMPKLEELIDKLNSKNNQDNIETIPDRIMVIVLDINDFKLFNDKHGHEIGDKALLAFSNRLKTVIKDTDFIFRSNKQGDEFIILLQIFRKDTKPASVYERIRNAVNENLSIRINGEDFPISASVGYSILGKGEPKTAEELLREADLKMYEDKGRKNKPVSHAFKGNSDMFSKN